MSASDLPDAKIEVVDPSAAYAGAVTATTAIPVSGVCAPERGMHWFHAGGDNVCQCGEMRSVASFPQVSGFYE